MNYISNRKQMKKGLILLLIHAIGIIFDGHAHRAAQVDGFHLVESQRDAAGGVGVALAGHKVVQLAIATQVGGYIIGVSRVGIIANVKIEDQVADLAGIFHASILNRLEYTSLSTR